MKHRRLMICIWVIWVAQSALTAAANAQTVRIKKPKECYTSKYSCVLKKDDGVPYFCVKTTKQRYQNARQPVRIVRERTCLRRYPVEYETVGGNPANSE
jgi:hypothetical protein